MYQGFGPWLVVTSALVASGCAGRLGLPPLERGKPVADAALHQAVEAFYNAESTSQLRAAVKQAAAAGPNTSQYHDIAAELAMLEDRDDDQIRHLELALLDVDDPSALLHLRMLRELDVSQEQRAAVDALFDQLMREHPNAEVRASAAWALAQSAQGRGDESLHREAVSRVTGHLSWMWIGPWSNDQGRGFDALQEPEQSIDLRGVYQGAVVPVRWRGDVPADADGDYDLGESFSPTEWGVAFALSAVTVPAAGEYELRINSTDPLKIWVNQSLMFHAERVEGYAFDQFVIPVKLRAGVNRILIKSAHRAGNWFLGARLTGLGGTTVAVTAAPFDAPVAEGGASSGSTSSASADITRFAVPENTSAFHRLQWIERKIGGQAAVEAADRFVQTHPGGVLGRHALALALWRNRELSRTGELLSKLDRDVGAELTSVRLAQASYVRQQGLRQTARELLLSVSMAHPDSPSVHLALGDLFAGEGWKEDSCSELATLDRLRPRVANYRLRLAQCNETLGFDIAAERLYREVLAEQPNNHDVLLHWIRLLDQRRDYPAATRSAETLVRAFPNQVSSWLLLADLQWHGGKPADAEISFQRALALNPDSFRAWNESGELAYQRGDRSLALKRWRAALEHDPSEEQLAHRVEFLSPTIKAGWAQDIPDEAALDATVKQRETLRAEPGAEIAYLLDHRVSHFAQDGSTSHVVTQVTQVLTIAGRDRFTHFNLGGGGHLRILHAYSIDPAGRRTDVASTQGSVLRFQGLDVGSTVVIQYRHDLPPSPLLTGYVMDYWAFQGVGKQALLSQWIVWAPTSTELHEERLGDIQKEEQTVHGMKRAAWTMRNVPPVLAEPAMPPETEVAAHLWLSTVPSWETFAKWLGALLEGVFDDSPKLGALAQTLFHDAPTAEAKLQRIQQYIEESFRYEIERETFITNWRPHPVSVVLERRYGDCKDRAALFIALARKAGLDAHLALLNTRGSGLKSNADTPMPRFNHAIVYIPAQPGIAEGRFMDPTTDGLDIDVLREDDAGVQAFTYDPKRKQFAWHEIPFQGSDFNRQSIVATVKLTADGAVDGEFEDSGKGNVARLLRLGARNPEVIKQALQRTANGMFDGATVVDQELVEVKDLLRPTVVKVKIHAAAAAQREGNDFRVALPGPDGFSRSFELERRRHPLRFTVPSKYAWRTEMTLPPGFTARRLPTTTRVVAPCFKFERTSALLANRVIVEESLSTSCERISVEDYPLHRDRAQEIRRLLEERLVVSALDKKERKKARLPWVAGDSAGTAP